MIQSHLWIRACCWIMCIALAGCTGRSTDSMAGKSDGEGTTMDSLVLNHSEALNEWVFAPDGSLTIETDCPVAKSVIGRVTRIDIPFIRSPSISGDRWTAMVDLEEPIGLGPIRDVEHIVFKYHDHGLVFQLSVGDRLVFEFGSEGEFLDVYPLENLIVD